MAQIYNAALPIAYVLLRILIIVNWVLGAGILGLLVYTFVNEPWTMKALGVTGYPDAHSVMNGMRAVAALGVVAILFNYGIFKRLVAMVETVRAGDPFVADNAYRLQGVAWFLLALQLIGLAISIIARFISTPEHPFKLDAGMSVNGWLAVLLTFILARVFAEGTLMREDLEGTV